MKKIFLLGLVLCVVQLQAQISPIQREINEIPANRFIKEKLLVEKIAYDISVPKDITSKYSLLGVDNNILSTIANNAMPFLEIEIPLEGNTVSLQLIKSRSIDNKTIIKTSDGKILSHDGSHYYGTIKDQANSLVSISFFNNNIMGFISNKNGNYSIGKIKMKNGQEEYMVFNDKDMKAHKGFTCGNVSKSIVDHSTQSSTTSSVTGTPEKCLSVYIVTDYDLFTKFSGNTGNIEIYATAMFNGMASIYINESIAIHLDSLLIHISSDPYGTGPMSIQNLIDNFRTAPGVSSVANLAHLFSGRSVSGGQGAGYLNTLCVPPFNVAVSTRLGSIAPTYNTPLPAEVALITHEMGHNLGANHTHTCSYGGAPLDGCGFISGAIDICGVNPGLPVLGGTIMSYCDAVSGVGILLANGFGILPGNVVRATVAASTCTQTCSTTCNSNVIIDGANYIGNYYTQVLTESSNWIKTSGRVIVSGGTVKLDADASGYVELNAGFETTALPGGSVFTAQAFNGCMNGSPSFTSRNNNYSGNKGLMNSSFNKEMNSFSVYPNPATEHFTLISDFDLKDATIELFDVNGKLQKVNMLTIGIRSKKIAVTNLSKGMYLIKVKTKVKTEFAKIIVH